MFASISSIETPDDHTVVFKLSSPDDHDGWVCIPFNAIYSAKGFGCGSYISVKNVNGTGHMFDEHVKGEAYKAVRLMISIMVTIVLTAP